MNNTREQYYVDDDMTVEQLQQVLDRLDSVAWRAYQQIRNASPYDGTDRSCSWWENMKEIQKCLTTAMELCDDMVNSMKTVEIDVSETTVCD